MKKSEVVVAVEENVAFLYAAVIDMIEGVFVVDLDGIFLRHEARLPSGVLFCQGATLSGCQETDQRRKRRTVAAWVRRPAGAGRRASNQRS
jgi:hypothetical protein